MYSTSRNSFINWTYFPQNTLECSTILWQGLFLLAKNHKELCLLALNYHQNIKQINTAQQSKNLSLRYHDISSENGITIKLRDFNDNLYMIINYLDMIVLVSWAVNRRYPNSELKLRLYLVKLVSSWHLISRLILVKTSWVHFCLRLGANC